MIGSASGGVSGRSRDSAGDVVDHGFSLGRDLPRARKRRVAKPLRIAAIKCALGMASGRDAYGGICLNRGPYVLRHEGGLQLLRRPPMRAGEDGRMTCLLRRRNAISVADADAVIANDCPPVVNDRLAGDVA